MSRNKYPEETVQKILDAALKLFLDKGYEQTTILDIVDNLGGLTRGAFYHHFKSKEEVLDALGDRLFYDNNPFEKVKQRSDLNGLEKLKYILIDSLEITDRRKINNMAVSALQSPAFLKKLIDDNRDVLAPQFCEIVEEGVKDGSIKTGHPKLLSELIVLMTNFWTVPTIFSSSTEESVEKLIFIKEITDLIGLPLLNDDILSMIVNNAMNFVTE